MKAGQEHLLLATRETSKGLERALESQKTKHPAFGAFNGHEWYQLIGMHFRYHLRQKRRLDQHLAREHR